ncbi:MAG TPA: ribose-5-phosphate isomerase [Phycisphaerales bacterium]|nr:ribose-5-phosphate isomerase [Phycisphaerales bacterium]HCD34848.1 ribose-5-phosphate isomerase [Phycisphaerales bacterium]|tara:strand:+ start:59 stop:514 length:456 start_codon:yes stop_codon:yes gene_type:complete
MKIALACDHAGFAIKQQVIEQLVTLGCDILDLGASEYDANDDYPDFAQRIAVAISSKQVTRGIILCGTGVGAVIAANKFKGVYACLCHDPYTAQQAVINNDLNLLCIGSMTIGKAVLDQVIHAFVTAQWGDIPRHARRLKMIQELEAKQFG